MIPKAAIFFSSHSISAKKQMAKRICILAVLLLLGHLQAFSQPWFDPGGVTFWHQPGKGKTPEEWMRSAFLSVPVTVSKQFKVVVSPFYENRRLVHEGFAPRSFQSGALPLTLLYTSRDTSAMFTLTSISRLNGLTLEPFEEVYQQGFAAMVNFRVNKHLRLKGGLYYNHEFFSDYFVPLAGIEWRINPRMQLYGTIPNSMKWEIRIGEKLYGGLAYKSITNSYRMYNGTAYMKIMDNHAAVYFEYYLTGKVVIAAEAGHTFMRSIRYRNTSVLPESLKNQPVLKLGCNYRIRFD